ncbi:phospholipid-transporting ATPase ABCA3-like isoform X1 [Biomphalaria glabrata]|uniref:Phospholipid-transporting ATPase ABCA3-like isoform X1 n=2 Tax=Biomphalaria glabrata TaxID=6526 RepID=A0A9W3A5A2_BIOGL|nr:phospholipid-transporting ATPase ABCA3-like isoform X1 [Biomphalaria glabrata]XP_055882497.1 phospholipid-transporting ATPase ABCA3-like isoform X1 [Biomphalaria glabrata]
MGFFKELCLLLWKNWLLQKRKPFLAAFEVLLPIVFAIILVLIRLATESQPFPRGKFFEIKPFSVPPPLPLAFTPQTTETIEITKYLVKIIRKDFERFGQLSNAFESDDAFIDEYKIKVLSLLNNTNHSELAVGYSTEEEALRNGVLNYLLVFSNVNGSIHHLPWDIKVTLRPQSSFYGWRTQFTYPFFQRNSPRIEDGDPNYEDSYFIYVLYLVGKAVTLYWMNEIGSNTDDLLNFGVYTQRMPYPPYTEDPMIIVIQKQLPLFIVLSLILSVVMSTKHLVYEKEKQVKESMKLMGLSSSVHWISWYITFSCYLVPAMAVYTILCCASLTKNGSVIGKTDASLLFVFFLCYIVAVISFIFMVSTFVQKANTGATVSGVLFIGFFFSYFFIQRNYENYTMNTKIYMSFLFNVAMALGVNIIGIFEGTGEGAQWSNFHKPATVDDNLSLLACMFMLLVDSGIHFMICWYLDNVRPGELGIPKPFYFCFTKSYWFAEKVPTESFDRNMNLNPKYFEREPLLNPGIQIFDLRKTFGVNVAVKGTSLNMYEGQITVLLGHNGAGKTTTMSMLTGFIPPTSGTAIINGYDIRKDIVGVRKSLGVCLQHNILFDIMTVREHLTFFVKLKGYTSPNIDAEVISMAEDVGLATKIDTASANLSGGQKRMLSVGIALIGGSKIVFLDEPTAGMDPAARRQTWNVLQSARRGRTIVLSTHYMDEADLLGDRIAIMAEGVVKCCGSSLFLKKLYGAGYHLVIVKHPHCNVGNLTIFIKEFINTAELESVINSEVSYILPDNESSKFAVLFNSLDDKKEMLGIISFGTTATTMEEVFLKVGDSAYDEDTTNIPNKASDKGSNEIINNSLINEDNIVKKDMDKNLSNTLSRDSINYNVRINSENNRIMFNSNQSFNSDQQLIGDSQKDVIDILAFNKTFTKNQGFDLQCSRFLGLLIKKAIHTWRNRHVTVTQLLLPALFTIYGLAIDESRPKISTQPKLVYDLKPFTDVLIPYSVRERPSQEEKKFLDLYAAQFPSYSKEFFKTTASFSFSNYTIRRAQELGASTYNKKMVIGMALIEPKLDETMAAVAEYSGQPYHALPVSVNYLMNSFLQFHTNSSFSFQSSIHPLPKDELTRAELDSLNARISSFTVGVVISFGMAFLTTLFVYFPIKERQIGSKHMQVMCGIRPFSFWLPTFTWDYINYMIPSLFLLVVFASFSKTAYTGDGRWGLVILNLAAYGWSVLPFMYALHFAFQTPPSGVVFGIVINIFSGLITTTTVFILQLPNLKTEHIAANLDNLFKVIFPNYNMATAFISIYTNYLNHKSCLPILNDPSGKCNSPCCPAICKKKFQYCIEFQENYLAWDKPGIGSYLVFMTAQGFLFFVLVFLIEYHIIQQIWSYLWGMFVSDSIGPSPVHLPRKNEDSDVANERRRINLNSVSVLSETDALLLVNLTKHYGNLIAVDHICLGVPEQECFGLLGQNGAGKTTTFKMLTGDVMVTEGNAYLKGFDIRSDIRNVQANMGYCPQFDALIDQMTGRETLYMYARLRGVPEKHISNVVNNLIDLLMFWPHENKLVGAYSGGNKRKLSTAIALIGDPPFIMLDEPSAGMDPKARRQLWNVLSQVRASGRTLVLTSHSMEECDALCTRIAIMVNGKFMCLGSPQHLKNKFGQGYTLIVQLGTLPDGTIAPNEPVVDYILENFPGTKVFDDHQGYIHFQVPDTRVRLADVFTLMETTKLNLNVSDYSVHQTTLEQVFLTFTKGQVVPIEEMDASQLKKNVFFIFN